MHRNNTFFKNEKIPNDGKGEEKEMNTYRMFSMCQTVYMHYSKESCKNSTFLQRMELIRLREIKESVQGHRANMIDCTNGPRSLGFPIVISFW